MATRNPQDRDSGFHVHPGATTASASSADIAAQLEAVIAAATAGAKPLSAGERRRLLNPRTGWEAMLPIVADLAERYGLAGTIAIDRMEQQAERARELRPVLGRLVLVERTMRDAIAGSQSEAWSLALAAYSILGRLAVGDPRLAIELAPVRAFLASGRRAAAEAEGAPEEPAPAVEDG